jgi:hypothetical protein
MDNNKNFYLSAFVAIGSYLFLISLFFLYVSVNNVKKFDSFSKDTVLELDIVLQDTKQIKNQNIKKLQLNRKDSKISKKIVKKSASVSSKQRTDLKSLFANVKIKSNIIKKKVISNVQKSSITSRFKSKFEKQSKHNNNILSKLMDTRQVNVVKQKTGDASNEHDPYISKIYEILYNRWRPLLIVDGLSTKVLISITSKGKFNYRVLQFSGDNSFDNQLVLFLEGQKNEIFPQNTKDISIEVIFTAKG